MKSGFKLLSIMLCMILSTVSNAQYLNKLYDLDGTNDFCSGIRQMPNGNLLLAGGALQSDFYSAAAALVLDSTGTFINKYQVITPPWNYGAPYGRLKETYGGTFIQPVSMYMYNSSGTLKGRAGYIEFDTNGEALTVKSFTDTLSNYEASEDFIQLPDSSFLLCGERFYKTYTGIEFASGFIYKLNKEGNVIWRRLYDPAPPSSLGTFFQSIQYKGGDTILVGGYVRYYQASTVEYINRPYFALLDTAGNVLYDHLYNSSYRGGGNIFKDKSGGYYHWGNLDSLINPSEPLSGLNHPGYVAHLDDSFNVAWIYVIYDTLLSPYHSNAKNILQLTDSNYLVMASHISNDVNGIEAKVMKISKEGNLIWQHRLHVDTGTYDCYLVDAVERPDKSLLLVGSAKNAFNPVPWNQDFWLIGLDSNGCIEAGCSPTGVVQLPPKEVGEVQVYPNPTKGALTIDVPEEVRLSVVNMQGQQVAVYELHAGENQLKLPNSMAPGLYMGRLMLKNGKQTLVKIIYQP